MTRTQGYTYELLERRGEGHTDFVGVQSWDSFAPALAAWRAERNWLVHQDVFIPRRRLVRMAETWAGVLYEAWLGLSADPVFDPNLTPSARIRYPIERHFGVAGWVPASVYDHALDSAPIPAGLMQIGRLGVDNLHKLSALTSSEQRVAWGRRCVHRVSADADQIDGLDPHPSFQTWVTKARVFIPVEDMKSDHVRAAANYLARRIEDPKDLLRLNGPAVEQAHGWLRHFATEMARRGQPFEVTAKRHPARIKYYTRPHSDRSRGWVATEAHLDSPLRVDLLTPEDDELTPWV